MVEEQKDPNQDFYDKAARTLRELFEKAKEKHELHFVMALMPEMRGQQDGGWNTAEEAARAYEQFSTLLETIKADDIVRIRVILAFYQHMAECSGFYEIPKKMLNTIEGKGNNILPFQKIVKRHRKTGQAIAPNANAIMKNLMGHSFELGLRELSEIFQQAFDTDLRNAIAHADYTLAPEGMRLRKRNGGYVRVIKWDEFDILIGRGINLFSIIRQIVDEYVQSYHPPKTIKSRLDAREPIIDYTLYYDPTNGAFGFITGSKPPDGYNKGGANAAAQ